MDKMFKGIFDTNMTQVVSVADFIKCLVTAMVVGIILAMVYMFKTRYTKSFVVTLALLPAVVCVVIMMVNGNVGAGVAVAGAFSLVRFRSVPGTAKEIAMIFLAMASGLICGMGYLGFALLFTVVMGVLCLLYNCLDFGEKKNAALYKTLHIVIPEDLDYTDVFKDVLDEYTSACDLIQVKTTNMGSLFKLTYNITLKNPSKEKDMIDALRCRNGNLEITISRQDNTVMTL